MRGDNDNDNDNDKRRGSVRTLWFKRAKTRLHLTQQDYALRVAHAFQLSSTRCRLVSRDIHQTISRRWENNK